MINLPAPPPKHPPSRPSVSLEPLTAAGASQVEGWFDHPEVQHWLGGRFWIHRELRLIGQRPGTTFRGKTVLRSYGWIARSQQHEAVAFIGGDVYDRWVRYHGEGPHAAVLSDEDPRRSMGLSYVVNPARWRHGYGQAAIQAALHHTELTDVEVFYCGIDTDNHASQRCCMAAGFRLADPQPDHEDTLYFRHERRQTSRR